MIKITPSGDSILLLENFEGLSSLQVIKEIKIKNIKGLEDIISLKDKVGVIYNPFKITSGRLRDILHTCLNRNEINFIKNQNKTWKIPICYDNEFSLDIENLCSISNLDKDYIINKHLELIYTVDLIGFLPGFLYLGNLDKTLFFNRKSNPRKKILKGSVGIAGNQTGIYNIESPGGWNIIGRTPMELFKKNKMPPLEINQGDKIKFFRISKSEFNHFKNE